MSVVEIARTAPRARVRATETLDLYGHLWPDADDRTRDAVSRELADLLANPAPDPDLGGAPDLGEAEDHLRTVLTTGRIVPGQTGWWWRVGL